MPPLDTRLPAVRACPRRRGLPWVFALAGLVAFDLLWLIGHTRWARILGLEGWGAADAPAWVGWSLAHLALGALLLGPRAQPLALRVERWTRSRGGRRASALCVAAIVSATAAQLGPGLARPALYNEDAAIYTFAFWPHAVPGALADDPSAAYARALEPWGCRALYSIGARLCGDPLRFANLLAALLATGTLAAIYAVGRRLAGPWGGALAALAFWQAPGGLSALAGAHPRAFCLPLVAAALACWTARRERVARVLSPLAALLYPPAYALLALASALRLVPRLRARRLRRGEAVAFALAHGLGATLVLAWAASSPYGVPTSRAQAERDPHWTGVRPRYDRATRPPFPAPLHEGASAARAALPSWASAARTPTRAAFGWTLLCLFLAGFRGRGPSSTAAPARRTAAARPPPTEAPPRPPEAREGARALPPGREGPRGRRAAVRSAFALGAAAILLYVLARPLAFRLYVPGRYLAYTLPLLLPLLLAFAAAALHRRLRRRDPAATLAAAVGVLGFLAASAACEVRLRPRDRGLLEFGGRHARVLTALARRLPPNAVAFATGRLASDLPLWARRRALWSPEAYQVFHPPYVAALDERLRAACAALLDPDGERALARWRALGATHLVFDEATWRSAEERRFLFYSPLCEEYGPALAAQTTPPWERLPAALCVWRSEGVSVWRVPPR